MTLKDRVIAAGFRGIAAAGADRWLRPVARGRGVILTLHHVRPASADPFQPNRLLEITPEFLDDALGTVRRLGFDLVPLAAVPERLRSPGPPFVALTFDDGYRDNRDHALPVLRRHGAPWTLFVTRDYATGTGRLWWVELEEVVRRSDALTVGEGDAARLWPAGTPAEKDVAFAAAYRDLRAGPEKRLRATLAGWCDGLGIDRDGLVRRLCLSWDEIRALAAEAGGPAIGSHTLTHPMLAKHDAATARREIRGGREAVEAALGRPAPHLAYPVGDPTSAGPREFVAAGQEGCTLAVTTRPGHLFAEHRDHLTALPRVSLNGLHQSRAAVEALLSGVPFLLWNRGRRLNVA